MNRIWLLEHIGRTPFDAYDSFVIRAPTEEDARALAEARDNPDTDGTWTDPERSTCERISPRGEPGIISSDFNGG